jgi:membrane AbrB-like protein
LPASAPLLRRGCAPERWNWRAPSSGVILSSGCSFASGGDVKIDLTLVPVLVAGLFGALVGRKLGVPAGVLTGTMVGVGGMQAVMGFPEVPAMPMLNQSLQVLVGILVGLRITRASVRSGVQALVPATLLTAAFIASSVGAALAATSLAGVDPRTALFAAAPGGLTEMASVGASLGADGAVVAAVHLVRLLLVIAAINVLMAKLRRREPPASGNSPGATTGAPANGNAKSMVGGLAMLGTVVSLGILGGIAGLATPLPAGGVVGALFAVALVRLLVDAPLPERGFYLGVQALSGGVIGLSISGKALDAISGLAGAAVIMTLTQMLVWVAACYLLEWLARYDVETAVFSSAPGGMSNLISASAETTADTVIVAFTHLLRLSTTILVVPALVLIVSG